MKILTDRQKQIISLLKTNETQTGKQLCDTLKISLRTLQSDIAQINKSIGAIRSSNRGYCLIHDKVMDFQSEVQYDQRTSHVILKKLIFTSKPISLNQLADELYISSSTLLRHLDDYKALLSTYHISVQRKHNMLHIDGNEFNKRCFINYLINSEAKPLFWKTDNLSNYFPNIDIEEMKQVVLKVIHQYGCFIDETYFPNMFLNIVIAFYRMKSNAYIEAPSDILLDKHSCDYKIAKDICDFYIDRWRISPMNADMNYIASILHGQIKISLAGPKTSKNQVISDAFIADIDRILLETFNYYMLNINYKEQLYSFALHVDALIKRAKYQQNIVNDLLESIQINSPFIYDVAVMTTKKISETFKIHISAQEIGYISIHLGFLIENASKEKGTINVLLISSGYHQIEKNIIQHLQAQFHDSISILSIKALDNQYITSHNVDVLITTQPIQIIGKLNVTISPFYTADDEMLVNEVIMRAIKEKEKHLSHQLLMSYFHEDLFIHNETITTREDAIHYLAQKIVDFGLANQDFVSSVLKREELSSTCFFDTFAIPHALDMNAKKTMFCVLVNKNGIEWGEGKKICLVFMIAVRYEDRKEFMKIYNGIIRSLCNQDKIKKMLMHDTFAEFIQQLGE